MRQGDLPQPLLLDDLARQNEGAADYEDDGPLHLTRSQEDSGLIAAGCFVAALLIGAVALCLHVLGVPLP